MKITAEQKAEKMRMQEWLRKNKPFLNIFAIESAAELSNNQLASWLNRDNYIGIKPLQQVANVIVQIGYIPTMAING